MEKLEAAKLTADMPRGTNSSRSTRSETISMRLEPRLRYLAELAARKDRRTLSSFIETIIEAALDQVTLVDINGDVRTLGVVGPELWDVFAPDRFVKLALRFPGLLNHHEEIVWKLITENGYVWKGGFKGGTEHWVWAIQQSSLNWSRLREYWVIFNAVANGELPTSALPEWQRYPTGDPRNKPAQQAQLGATDGEDIPF